MIKNAILGLIIRELLDESDDKITIWVDGALTYVHTKTGSISLNFDNCPDEVISDYTTNFEALSEKVQVFLGAVID